MFSWNNGYLRPKNPHFFQIVMEDGVAMRQQKLWIPRRFMRDYGSEISKHVQVVDPCGRKWNLECLERNGEIWLKKGWEDFADHYSLKHGHLLVFQYEGNAHFSVIILDMTATEIDYPIGRTRSNVGEIEKEAEEECEVTLGDSAPCLSRKRKESTPPRGRGRPKKGRTSLPSKPESNSKQHISSSEEGANRSVKKSAGKGIGKNTKVLRDDENAEDLSKSSSNKLNNSSRNTCSASKKQEFATSNKSRAFMKVTGLKSKNPSFDVTMKLAYLTKTHLPVPFKFASHFFKERRGDVILQNSAGKIWNVGYTMYEKYHYSRLLRGWRDFAEENNLRIGVKYNFKLINHDQLTLKVGIVRANTGGAKSGNSTGVQPHSAKLQFKSSCRERGKRGLRDFKCKFSSKNATKLTGSEKACSISKAEKAFQSKNPYFLILMQPSYVQKRLDIPFKFAKTHFKKDNCEIVLQNVDGNTSTIECRIYSNRPVAYLRCSNWIAFARDNNIEIGDVCVFELLNPDELLMKVVIIKNGGVRADLVEENLSDTKTEYDSDPDSEEVVPMCNLDRKSTVKKGLHKERAGRQSLEWPSRSQRTKITEAANKFVSSHPNFKALIKFSNFQNGVTVPVEFIKQTNLGAKSGLMFQLQLGERTWPVKYLYYPKSGVRRLASGWPVFAKQVLRVGVICAFELVDADSLVLKVTIFSPDD